MNLYEIDEEKKRKKNQDATSKKIIISMVMVVIIIIALIIGIKVLKNKPDKFVVYVDDSNKNSEAILDMLNIEENDDGTTSIYIPIRKFASALGYQSFDGTPETTENTDSCYTTNGKEISIFQVDSNVIYKKDLTIKNSEYESYALDKNVVKDNDELYLDMEGTSKALNFTYEYDSQKMTLKIFTLDMWLKYADSVALAKGYASMDTTFVNQKAVLDGMLVVKNEDSQYGVIDSSKGNEILGAQYENVTYIPQKSAFFITRNGKVGIMSVKDGVKQEMISATYDTLNLIDSENGLYLASKDGLYGVIDIKGNSIIYLEYDKIGIDISKFGENNVKTGYILLDNLIPVQQNGKWGFFDVKGQKVTNIEFDNVGCVSNSRKSVVYNLLLIKDYNVIAVQKNGYYGFIDITGKEVVPFALDDTYMQISSGITQYYMIRHEDKKEYNIIEMLEKNNITKVEN